MEIITKSERSTSTSGWRRQRTPMVWRTPTLLERLKCESKSGNNGRSWKVPKFPKMGLPRLQRPITFCENLQLKWVMKQSCSPHWNISNDMWCATSMQVNQGDYQLLVVDNQIGWLPALPSAITCVLRTQMECANPF